MPYYLDSDWIYREFNWKYKTDSVTHTQTIRMDISGARYNYYARKERFGPPSRFPEYAREDIPEIDSLTNSFKNLQERNNWSLTKCANNVLHFTQQCITYVSDGFSKQGKEWPRYPIETLVDGIGDCEDFAILAAAILKRLDLGVALLDYKNHIALGIAGEDGMPGSYYYDDETGIKYYYAETQASGWKIGKMPEEYHGQEIYLYPV